MSVKQMLRQTTAASVPIGTDNYYLIKSELSTDLMQFSVGSIMK